MPDKEAPPIDGHSTESSLSDRVFAVLSAFIGAPALGVTEIHRITGLDKSVVHRIVRAAVTRGFLRQDSRTHRYSVGLRAWELGQQYEGADRVVERATPVLERLSSERHVTSYLGRLDGLDVVYLALIDSPGPIRIVHEVGARVPATTTALGKVLLGVLDGAELERRLAGWATPARRDILVAEIHKAGETGYAMNRGEMISGVGAVGTLIPSTIVDPVAISAAFLMFDDNESMWEDLPPALLKAAVSIATSLEVN